jgi:FkbM family methyltransferase
MMGGEIFETRLVNEVIKPYIEKSKYIVDVGANIGCHTISYTGFNKDCTVWAFEPQQKLYEILLYNIKLNDVKNQVNAFQCGLGHESRNTSLSDIETVYDSLMMGYNKGGLGIGQGGEDITIVPLDSLNLPGLDFMKIDVEGAEGLVIQGARETIKKYKPVIFFEHNYQTINPEVLNLKRIPTPFEELVKLGYTTFKYVGDENYITEG